MTPREQNFDFSTDSTLGIRGRLFANSGLLGGSRIISALMGLATLIITARALDSKAAFGTVLFVHAYMLFFSEIGSFQIWQAVIRFGADDLKDKNAGRLSKLLKTGVILDALSAFAAYVLAVTCFGAYLKIQSLLGVAAPAFLDAGAGGYSLGTLVIGYCSVILFRQLNVSIGIFRLFDKFSVLAARALVMPTIRFLGAVLAFYMGWGVVGFLCVWYLASLLSYLTLQALAVIEVSRRKFMPEIRKAKLSRGSEIAGLYPFIVKTSLDSTLNSFKAYFPSVFIMFILGPAVVAVFRIAEEISRLLSRGVSLFDQVLFPELSKLVADKKLKELSRLTLRASLGVGAIGLFMSAIVLIFGEQLIKIGFEAGYEDVPVLSVMLLIATSLIGVSIPFYSLIYALKLPGRVIFIRIAAIMAYIVVFTLTYRQWGLYAAGWAAIGSAAAEVCLIIYFSRRAVKYEMGRNAVNVET